LVRAHAFSRSSSSAIESVLHQLVDRALEADLPLVKVGEDSDAGTEDLLDDVPGLRGLTAKPGFLADDEHAEGRPGLLRDLREQADETRTSLELGTGDAIVHEDVLTRDVPALLSGVVLRAVDLPGNRLFVLADAALVGGLAGVDGCNHPIRPFYSSPRWDNDTKLSVPLPMIT
jgi:hypothetical protein